MKKLSFLVAALCATTVAATAATKTVILDGSATGLTTTATTAESTISQKGFSYKMSKGGKSQAVPTAATKEFDGIEKCILIGKSGTYIYNTKAFGDKITKFELYANQGASAKVSVSVSFSASPITEAADDAWAATLATADHIYEVTVPEGAKYFYYKVTNANNSQVAFRITYEITEVDATAVALSETALELEQYKYVTLTVTPTPTNATDAWTWASDNTDVATVTPNGKVTIVAATGTANITVTSQTTPTVTATCVITAKAATVLTCAQAVEKAQAVSANNEIAAGGMYVIRGYVTKIESEYSTDYGNVSVWLDDVADGGQVFEAYRVVPVDDAAKAVGVGDFVEVVGDITKYNTTYETSAGGSLKIITKATPTALVAPELSAIYANGGTIEGIGAAGRIFTVSGMEVTSQNGALTSGIYIVKLGDKTQKIAVK